MILSTADQAHNFALYVLHNDCHLGECPANEQSEVLDVVVRQVFGDLTFTSDKLDAIISEAIHSYESSDSY